MAHVDRFHLRPVGRYPRQGLVLVRDIGEAIIVRDHVRLEITDYFRDPDIPSDPGKFTTIWSPCRDLRSVNALGEEHELVAGKLYEVAPFDLRVGMKRANNGLNRVVIQAPQSTLIYREELIQNR